MIDIENREHKPSLAEICEYAENPLFDSLLSYLESEYKPAFSMEFSGDRVLFGWNVKIKKAGRTLCTVYPRRGHFHMLLVVGRREKERVEACFESMCDEFLRLYNGTKEGMEQRWLLFDFSDSYGSPLYDDALKIVRIRRESR